MTQQEADTIAAAALALTTSGYAVLLRRLKRRYPQAYHDLTWLTVVTGNTIVLAAAELRHRAAPGDYRRAVWLAMIVGGTPIICWQLAEMMERAAEIIRDMREQAKHEQEQTDDQARQAVARRGRGDPGPGGAARSGL